MERWLPIWGYTGFYEVSDQGRVRNKRTGRVLKPRSNLTAEQLLSGRRTTPYFQVRLSRQGVKRNHHVHVLVMRAFVGRRPPGKDVHHLDEVTSNNRLDNLAYWPASRNRGRHKPHCPCPWCREADVQCDGDDLYFDYDQAASDWLGATEEAPF